MRDKLNNNPVAQIGLVLLLIVVGGYMFLGGGLGGGGEESSAEAPTAEAEVSATEGVVTVEGTVAPEGSEIGALESFAEDTSSSIPTPPLPHKVLAAYKAGKTVVLLIVHDGGIDDRLVESSTRHVAGSANVALFVVPSKQIDRYAAITLSVDVQQLPALVTLTPRRLDHGSPQAAVIYGFQSGQRIEQAIRDAEYDGPESSYHPN